MDLFLVLASIATLVCVGILIAHLTAEFNRTASAAWLIVAAVSLMVANLFQANPSVALHAVAIFCVASGAGGCGIYLALVTPRKYALLEHSFRWDEPTPPDDPIDGLRIVTRFGDAVFDGYCWVTPDLYRALMANPPSSAAEDEPWGVSELGSCSCGAYWGNDTKSVSCAFCGQDVSLT